MRVRIRMLTTLERLRCDLGPEVGDPCGVARVSNGEGKSVFHPVVPDAVGVVGCRGEGVLLRTEKAGELERDADGLARGDGSERQPFEFSVGAVDFESDAGANHDADDGLVDRSVELDGDADGADLAGLDDDGGLAVLTEGFQSDNFGATVAAAEGGEQVRRDGFSPGALAGGEMVLIFGKNFAVVAAGVQVAFMQPPDLVGQGRDQVEFMRRDKDDGAVAAKPFQA